MSEISNKAGVDSPLTLPSQSSESTPSTLSTLAPPDQESQDLFRQLTQDPKLQDPKLQDPKPQGPKPLATPNEPKRDFFGASTIEVNTGALAASTTAANTVASSAPKINYPDQLGSPTLEANTGPKADYGGGVDSSIPKAQTFGAVNEGGGGGNFAGPINRDIPGGNAVNFPGSIDRDIPGGGGGNFAGPINRDIPGGNAVIFPGSIDRDIPGGNVGIFTGPIDKTLGTPGPPLPQDRVGSSLENTIAKPGEIGSPPPLDSKSPDTNVNKAPNLKVPEGVEKRPQDDNPPDSLSSLISAAMGGYKDPILESKIQTTLEPIASPGTQSTIELAEKLVSQILVSESGAANQEVRLIVDSSVLKGTEIQLNRGSDGFLNVTLITSDPNSLQTLVQARDSLEQALSRTEGTSFKLSVEDSLDGQDSDDPNKRSRGLDFQDPIE
ncbi:MAG: hypothetical protein LBE31_01770 [Deltaproteobacteria bacterium]|jgi:type III secretion system needle length determinant|nr:hypothetical protein [Deltaproteobacteria bacterium]